MRPSWVSTLLGVAASAFLAVFFLLPLGVILQRSFADAGALAHVASNPFYWQRLGFTTGQALLSTLLTVAVGLPGALLFARYAFAGKRLLTAAFTIPFVMPTVVAGIGFLALFGRRGLLGLDLRNTLLLVLLAHVFYNYAIVVRVVGSFLEGAAPRLLEAASTLGAGAWRGTLRVSLPLARSGIIAGAVLAFARSLGEFGATITFAGNIPGATQTLPLAVFSELNRAGGDGAFRLAVVSVALAAAALAASEWLERCGRRG